MAWSTTGHDVSISKQVSCTVLFHSDNITVKQFETTITTETRGMTEDAAKNAVSTSTATDTSTPTQYWASINGRTVSITAVTGGTKTDKSSARIDESGQWVVTTTTHNYSVTGLGSDWGTTELDADGNPVTLSSSGDDAVVVSIEKTVSRLAWDVFQTLTTTVKEIRHVNTEANARSLVSANTPATQATPATVNYHSTLNGNDFVSAWVSYMNGTEKFASARRVSESEGWTVTVTEKEYGWSSPRAASYGNGWR